MSRSNCGSSQYVRWIFLMAPKDRPYRPRPRSTVSAYMSRIRGKGTRIERTLGSAMWRVGLRYRKQPKLPGKPDFVFLRPRVAVFCDSHFWHGYRWSDGASEAIRKNRDFWLPKIERNIERDKEVNDQLQRAGWVVVRFWEHEILEDPAACVDRVKNVLSGRGGKQEGDHGKATQVPLR